MEALGAILELSSFFVFLWAVVGLFSPQQAKLSGRVQAVGLLAVSAFMFAVGVAFQPEDPPTSAGRPVQTSTEQLARPEQVQEETPADRPTQTNTEQLARPEQVQVSGVTFAEVNDKFGLNSNLTDLQKGREWDAYEGLCVEWTGELVSLSEAFLSSGFTIQFKHHPATFVSDVLARAPASAEEELLTWSEGSRYTYRARLVDYSGVISPITVSIGCD